PTVDVMSVRTLGLSLLGIGWFWALAALLVGLLVPYGMVTLGGGSWTSLVLVASLAVGFIGGALTCSWLSRGVLELGVVPLGALGVTVFIAFLWFGGMVAAPTLWHAYAVAVPCGTSLAWFVVPLYALIYHRSEPSQAARIAARCDRISSAFAIGAAVILWGAFVYQWPAHWIFLAMAAVNAAVAFFIYAYAPEFALRFVIWLLAHVLYRVRVINRENLPLRGPAVLVCNHVTFVDWLIIGSASPLPVRFVMHYSFMNIPLLKHLFKDAKIIPIAGAKEDPETLEKAFERIAAALADNEIVCIFPEGKLTTDGKMNGFRPGIEKIIARSPVPVTPMALVGMWGSLFSKSRDKRVGKRVWSKVTLLVDTSVAPSAVTALELEGRVRRLGALE
ncbi:MAG: 1-acyl-sn-glycerol-3-phosphate acyltransferase, partial [Myxococcota bacterium]